MEFFDLNKLFNWSRLADPVPRGDWQFIWWAIGISVGLIILAIVRAFWPGDLILKHKTEAWLWTLGICSLILTFFRWQAIPYFSSRILWLALTLWALIWLLLIIYYRQVKLKQNKLKLKAEQRRKKYL